MVASNSKVFLFSTVFGGSDFVEQGILSSFFFFRGCCGVERNPQRDWKTQKMLAENNYLLSQESRDLRKPMARLYYIETQQTWISWINRMILQKHFPRGDLFQDLFGTVKGGRMGLR